MAIWIVEVSREGYKIREIFGQKLIWSKEIFAPNCQKLGFIFIEASKMKVKRKNILSKKWVPILLFLNEKKRENIPLIF